jgi:hypothetical protein
VGSNTIAGHATISGVHANLVNGSIVGSDLSPSYRSALKVQCTAGLLAVGDICVESALRSPAAYDAALATCASVGRRLPDDAEMALALTGLGAPQDAEWTSGRFVINSLPEAGFMQSKSDRSLFFGWEPLTYPVEFRCIVSPHN